MLALWFAYAQLRGLRESATIAATDASISAKAAQHNVEIARATLLLEIDRQFESPDLYKSRKAIRALRHRAQDAIAKRDEKDRSNQNLQRLQMIEMSHQMDQLWAQAKKFDDVDVDNARSPDVIAADRYTELLGLPNWIETIGMLCQRGLLPKDDILNLYDQVIIPTMESIKLHIDERRTEKPYPNPGFMENAYWLCDEAVRYKAEREKPIPAPPAPANLFG